MRLFLLAVLTSLPCLLPAQTPANPVSPSGDGSQIPLVFTGGYETDPRDRGRPVILIASALKVSSDVFRKAFSNVRPAHAGQEPQPDQVRKNKQALMESLSPYGVTNDRLNEVSNYYRYNRSKGEMWRTTPAAGYATMRDGKVVGVTITNAGSGYSSAPVVSVSGQSDFGATATLAFDTDFAKNGSIAEIKLGSSPSQPSSATP